MTQQNVRETVLAFIKAMNEEDFKTARSYAAPEMDFIGVMGTPSCDWYHLVDGKIREFRVLFDPRPLL